MIDLALVKRNMMRYVQDVRAVRGMGRDLSDHHVLICKIRLVLEWIKRRVEVGPRKIRNDKMREHHYREEYARSLEGKELDWDGDNNVEH